MYFKSILLPVSFYLISVCASVASCQTRSPEKSILQEASFTLSTANPSVTVKPDPRVLERLPELLEFRIAVLENANLSNFSVGVYLIIDKDEEVSLGSATPYPVNSSGKFVFRVDKPLKETRKEVDLESLKLRFAMKPESKANIVVRVDSLKWLFEDH